MADNQVQGNAPGAANAQGPQDSGQNTLDKHVGDQDAGNKPDDLVNIDQIVKKRRQGATVTLIAIVVILVAVIGVAYYLFVLKPASISTTTVISSPTTIASLKVANIDSCGIINTPGLYYITQDIVTQITNGTCIDVTSSNVEIVGNKHNLAGNGPYVQVAPYSYGIELSNVQNVTVSGLNITKFSYGIYLNKSSNDTIKNVTIANSTITNVYLYDSSNNYVEGANAKQAQGYSGAIYLYNGKNNTIRNDNIEYNTFYGIRVNSTGNNFTNDTFVGNPVDLVCSVAASFPISNKYSSSTCYVNDYCNFAHCSQQNTNSNISSINLTNKNIASCGGITIPGKYYLSGSLNMENYLNTSFGPSKQIPCLTISSPNVKLDCKGNSITNAGFGVYVVSKYNVSVVNCNFNNDVYGLFLANLLQTNISSDRFTNNTRALYVYNSTYGNLTNLTFTNNKYGAYLNSSSLYQITGYVAHGNLFGAYLDKSSAISVLSGNTTGNTQGDFYCSPDEYNFTTNLFQNTVCGTTDCKWAYPQCKTYILPSLAAYPINNCTTIVSGGNYTFTANIIGHANCVVVNANDVNIDCHGLGISSKDTAGAAFVVNNRSLVSISHCSVYQFAEGIVSNNTKYLVLTDDLFQDTATGLLSDNLSDSLFGNVTVSSYLSNGFIFNSITSSIVGNDTAHAGTDGLVGFSFTGAKNNTIINNNATLNKAYGYFFNNSRQNFIYNNSAALNNLDYYCSPDSSGLEAQTGVVNYGEYDQNCDWLVKIYKLGQEPQCFPITSPQRIVFTSDFLYTYGQTCFDIYNTSTSNPAGTIINCNYHTIYAPNGGTFVTNINGSDVVIENCYLNGFNTTIMSSGSGVQIYNNTIGKTGIGIYVRNSSSSIEADVINNTVLSGVDGIIIKNTSYANINDNHVSNVTNGMQFESNTVFDNVLNNTVKASNVAISISESAQDIFENDLAIGSAAGAGFMCDSSSGTASSHNTDSSGNSCSSNSGCLWMTNSAGCHA